MPIWAQVVVAASDAVRPIFPPLVTLLAALFAWVAIHRVSRLNAKREAYARYVGAAEIYANDLARWMKAVHTGLPSAVAKPVTSGPVNEPLGAILLVAPIEIVTLVQEAQQALNDLAAAASGIGDWTAAVRSWQAIRARLIGRMREDSGSERLPDEFHVRS